MTDKEKADEQAKIAADAAAAAKIVEGQDPEAQKALTEDVFEKGIKKIEEIATNLAKSAEVIPDKEDFSKKATLQSDDIKKGVEVSPFLRDLVEEVGESLGKQSDTISTTMKDYGEVIKSLTETVRDVVKGLTDEVKAMKDQIKDFESQPVSKKKAITKSVERFGDPENAEEGDLSKSQVIEKLTAMHEVGKCSAHDIVKYETTGLMKPQLFDMIFHKKEV